MVVRGLDGHLDVVRVALLEAGGGDAHELPALLELRDRVGADVEHRLVQAADQLARDGVQGAAVGHYSTYISYRVRNARADSSS